METQEKLGEALLSGLMKLKEQSGGKMNLQDVGGLFTQIASKVQGEGSVLDKLLRAEIEKLATFIHQAKEEISSFSDSGVNSSADAQEQLAAVVKTTEEASNTIMDAADSIQGAIAGIGGEAERIIMEATTRIYEACNFQDLTGQRLTKVGKVLSELDTRVEKILSMFGQVANANGTKVINGNFSEKDLLNGPQLPNSTPSQADIDALFAGFKG